MNQQVIITPCLLEGGNAGAIVVTTGDVYPIAMPAVEVGNFVNNLFNQRVKEDSNQPAK